MICFGTKNEYICYGIKMTTTMKRLLSLVAVLLVTLGAYAQNSGIPVINEIVSVDSDEDDLFVFSMKADDGTIQYYLCVGSLAVGDEVVQILFDPVFKLFLPLGGTLDEAIASLTRLQDIFKEPVNSSIEWQGSLAFGFPNDQLETVTVTYRRPFIMKKLEFSLQREGYIRAAYVDKSDLNTLLGGTKFHKKLHPAL